MITKLLLALQAAAVSTAAPYPSGNVLEAFDAACRNIASIEAVETDLAEQKWALEIPATDSPLDRLLAVGRAGAAKILDEPGDKMSDARVYTKTVSGERLDIIVSRVESNGTFVNGCRLYDVAETRSIDRAAAEQWIGREADKTIDREEISIANWTPGYADGHDSFEIFYVPEGSPLIKLTQFNGIALKADFVGQIKK
ncbi:MAG: hypothetical protein ABJF89_04010 [Parasphingorhabdus sp.]|uniref:hypothetical protein n=1 Tax=Parasphingorhabdus sp. TaxID=2709688 RepID=UPI003262FFE3